MSRRHLGNKRWAGPLVRPLAQRWGEARTRGLAPISKFITTAGQSPASHPAAKPQHRPSYLRLRRRSRNTGLVTFVSGGGAATPA
jgi:hypothetical protein